MSFSCTLHPVDQRVAAALAGYVKEGRADWEVFLRLWRKKRLINRVNQPFKKGLAELLKNVPQFQPELQLWGRPFLIQSNDPEVVTQQITELYGMSHQKEIIRFYQTELGKISEPAVWERAKLAYPKTKEPALGLIPVVQELHHLYRAGDYQRLGSEIGFVLAQLLGTAYPYWYTGDYSLSFLKQIDFAPWREEPAGLAELFAELPELAPFLPQRLQHNLAAGIYLNPSQVQDLLAVLQQDGAELILKLEQKQVLQQTAANFIQKINEVLTNAAAFGYGLLEATDIFENEQERYP